MMKRIGKVSTRAKYPIVLIGICFVGSLLALCGCRGERSAEPPVHVQHDMDFQARFEAQEENLFFADKRAARPPVRHTVARDDVVRTTAIASGTREDGSFVENLPPTPDSAARLSRGKDRFAVYCATCHGVVGDGQAEIATRNMSVPPTSLFDRRVLTIPAGQIYDVIVNGVRTMPGYALQLPMDDRWAVVAYVRSLQQIHAAKQSSAKTRAKEKAVAQP